MACFAGMVGGVPVACAIAATVCHGFAGSAPSLELEQGV